MFGRAPQATACLQAGCRTFGQLERCSSACQSVAQIDQRDASAKNGKRHVCSEHIVFRGMFEAVIRQEGWSSEWQNMAQTDERRSAVNPACFKEHVCPMNYVALVS